MSATIIKSQSGQAMFIHGGFGSQAAISITGSKPKVLPDPHKNSKASEIEEEGKKDWVLYGTNDDFPKTIRNLMNRTTVGRAGLQKLTTNMYGQRLISFKVTGYGDGSKEEIQFVNDPKLKALLGRSNMKVIRLVGIISKVAIFLV